MSSLADRRATFRALHQSGCFAIPNPWDGGSAQRLAKAGFQALASTSAGAAWALGRAEAFRMPALDLDEVIARLKAYSAAGADVLYAPGLKTLNEVARVVAVVDKPVNANLTATGLSVQDFAKVGVRRVSVGGALARAAWAAFDDMAKRLATDGRLPSGY